MRSPRAIGAGRRRKPAVLPACKALPVAIENAGRQRLPAGTAAMLNRCGPGVMAAWRRPPEADTFTVKFVGDAAMRAFNLRFKGRDYATDVLSFATGDVVVSVTTARRQAAEMGHSLRRELVHLAVHGLLHLGGWEDATAARRARMERCTVAILDAAGVA